MAKEYINKIAVISIDVEEWYHLEYFKDIETNKKLSVLDGLDNFISIIDKYDVKATFFVVGELINTIKNKLIILNKNHHEIGVHSYKHKRPVEMDLIEFKNDVLNTVKKLNKIIPNKRYGYRAPCFAMDRERLDVLRSLDFNYDSSKINQKEHPLYVNLNLKGFKKTQNFIYEKENFREFEISTIQILGLSIPISGGGYLRIIPWPIYFWLFKKFIKKEKFFNFYIHPFELSNSNFKLPPNTPLLTRLRYSYGRNKVSSRLEKLIKELKKNNFEFKTFDTV